MAEENKYLDLEGLQYYTRKLQKKEESLIELLSNYVDNKLEWGNLGEEVEDGTDDI